MIATQEASVRLLTASRLASARACRREHHIKYSLLYRGGTEEHALWFGTLIHLMLEAWWRGPKGMRLALAMMAIPAGTDPFDKVRAEEMMRGYDARWSIDADCYEVLGVEVQFRCPVRNPATGRVSQIWELAGKIDVIVRDLRDGRVYSIEHKTSSEDISPGSAYFRKLRMDAQISIYFEGAGAHGYELAGCLYDVLGKPGLRPYKATPEEKRKFTKAGKLHADQREFDETPEEFALRIREDIAEHPNSYYQRAMVVRLESEITESLSDTWQLAQELWEAEKEGRAPRNPAACHRWNRECPFFDVCTGTASLEDESRFRKLETPHPELSLQETH